MKRFSILMVMAALVLSSCAQEGNDSGAAAESAEPVDLQALMASADADAGKRLYIYCQACHSLSEGGKNKVGPNLYGFFGRQAAQGDGFVYSAALSESGITWDAESLDKWIEGPAAAVPGTTMIFAGVKDPKQRADLIAYLKQATGAE